MYDDKVREFVNDIGVEGIGKRLVNSKEGKVVFEKPSIDLETLCSYGDALRGEQDNVQKIQLADTYLEEAALGENVTTH